LTTVAEKSASKQRGRPFKPGQSGNPSGKPKGTRHRATQLAQELLDGQAEALVQKLVDMALEGNAVALRVAVERLVPALRERPIPAGAVKLPALKAANLAAASAAIIHAVAGGRLTPGEGTALAGLLGAHSRAQEQQDFEARLTALERATKENDR